MEYRRLLSSRHHRRIAIFGIMESDLVDLEDYVSEQSLGDPEVSLNVTTSFKGHLEDLRKTEYKGTIDDLVRFIMNDEAPESRLLTLTKRYISLPEGPASDIAHPSTTASMQPSTPPTIPMCSLSSMPTGDRFYSINPLHPRTPRRKVTNLRQPCR